MSNLAKTLLAPFRHLLRSAPITTTLVALTAAVMALIAVVPDAVALWIAVTFLASTTIGAIFCAAQIESATRKHRVRSE